MVGPGVHPMDELRGFGSGWVLGDEKKSSWG